MACKSLGHVLNADAAAFQTEVLYAVWVAQKNYMHCYSTAAKGAFYLMCTPYRMIYMTADRRKLMVCLPVTTLGLMGVVSDVIWCCLRTTLFAKLGVETHNRIPRLLHV